MLLELMLRATGLPSGTIEPWLAVKPTPQNISGHAGEVVHWIRSFSPNEDLAVHWFGSGNSLALSLAFASNGWTPDQAARLKKEVFIQALRTGEGVSDIDDWMSCGLTPEFIFACFEANVASHHMAKRLYQAATTE